MKYVNFVNRWSFEGVLGSQQLMSENPDSHDGSGEDERICPVCGNGLNQDPFTGNWNCSNPVCGFRAIKLE